MIDTQFIADSEQYVARLTQSPVFFARELWHDRGLDQHSWLSEIEEDIILYAAGITHPTKFRGVLANRGAGKTHLVPATLTLFRLLRDYDRKVLIVSEAENHAKKIISLIRNWIETVWFLQHLRPKKDQKDSANAFQIGPAKDSLQPSVTAIGVDGQLEGNRAHSIFPDDIETEGNSQTLESRERIDQRVREFKDILYPERLMDEGGPVDPVEIVYIGTIHHEESVYVKLIERKYHFQTWPIATPQLKDKLHNLAPIIQRKLDSGELKYTDDEKYYENPVYPPSGPFNKSRFDSTNIKEKQDEGRVRFWMQHMLISDLGDEHRYPLRSSDLIVMDVPRDKAPVSVTYGVYDQNNNSCEIPLAELPHDGFAGNRLFRPAHTDPVYLPYTGCKAYVDPAGRGTDKTGLAIVAHLAGLFWVKGVFGLEGGVSIERLAEIAHLCRKHGAREIYVEDNIDMFNSYTEALAIEVRKLHVQPGADLMFPEGWAANIERTRAHGQKEVRVIAAIDGFSSTKRLVVDRHVFIRQPGEKPQDAFAFQFTRITLTKGCLEEDGKIDALGGCLAKWKTSAEQDPAKASKRAKDRSAAADYNEMKKRFGMKTKGPPCFITAR